MSREWGKLLTKKQEKRKKKKKRGNGARRMQFSRDRARKTREKGVGVRIRFQLFSCLHQPWHQHSLYFRPSGHGESVSLFTFKTHVTVASCRALLRILQGLSKFQPDSSLRVSCVSYLNLKPIYNEEGFFLEVD